MTTGPGQVTVNQSSERAVLNWQQFSIQNGETTTFVQPSGSSAALNRVTGGQLSQIDGQLNANGKVYLINPQGVVIGKTGRVNTGGFTASTLDVADQEFLAGKGMTFKGNSGASVINNGKIRAMDGDVTLIARRVENHGKISARKGEVHLAGGQEVLVMPAGASGQRVFIKSGPGSVENTGSIRATAAELRAAGGNEYALAVNNTGVIRATSVDKSGGRIVLKAEGTRGQAGRVKNSGRLIAKASAPGRRGGSVVVTSADSVHLTSASSIDASGLDAAAGTVHVGGGYQGRDATITNARTTTVDSGSVITADGTKGGTVVLWSDEATLFAGEIFARGTPDGLNWNGGTVEVSSKGVLGFGGWVDTRGGDLLLDPATMNIIAGGGTDLTATTVDPGHIANLLLAGNVTVQADNSITVTNTITQGVGGFDLTLLTTNGGSFVTINAPILLTSVGANLILNTPTLNLNVALSIAGTISGAATTVNLGANGVIQQAVDAASSTATATVNLAATNYLEHSIDIAKAITIRGQGSASTIIDANNGGRIFNITSSGIGTVTLDGLAILDGRVTATNAQGGGIRISAGATVRISNSAISSNEVRSGETTPGVTARAYGGGIYSLGNLTLDGVTMVDNSASAFIVLVDANGGAEARGGAIYSEGTLRIEGSHLEGNLTLAVSEVDFTTAGTALVPQSEGGGVWFAGNNLIINGTDFLQNSARTSQTIRNTAPASTQFTLESGASGGNLHIDSGTGHVITGSSFRQGQSGRGGGIMLESLASLELVDVTLEANQAGAYVDIDTPTGRTLSHSGFGGGIYTATASTLIVRDSTITSNLLGIDLAVTGTLGNPAGAYFTGISLMGGGAGLFLNGNAQIYNTAITTNRIEYTGSNNPTITSTASASAVVSADTRGAGIYFLGGNLLLQDSVISGNSAIAQANVAATLNSNSITTAQASVLSQGGGLIASGGSVSIVNSRFVDNTAQASGTNNAQLNSVINAEQADLFVEAHGGGIEFASPGTLQITSAEISENQVSTVSIYGTNGTGDQRRHATGGGLRLSGTGSGAIFNSTIALNIAGDSGGGIAATTFTVLTLDSVTVAYNSAVISGGGIYVSVFPGPGVSNSIISLNNTIIAGNTSPFSAPDVFAQGTNFFVSGPNIVGNVDGSNLVYDGVFYGNTADPTDPLLGTLDFYGGTTRTISLLAGSLAIDAGSTTLTYDQRGAAFVRPEGAADDIGAFEVRPLRNIIITPDALSKIYGLSDPTLTFTNTGQALYAGDTYADVLTGALNRALGESAGTYLIGNTFALTTYGATQYTFSFTSGVLFTIDPRTITVTADAQAKVYGNSDPTLSSTVTGPDGGLVSGDSITLTRAPGETVAGGPYAITVDTFVGASNYIMTYVGADLTINPRTITVTADTLSKTYGNADPTLTFAVTGPDGGLVSGDSITLARAPGETVAGSPYAVTLDTFTGAANYNLTYIGADFTILRRPIDLTPTGLGKNYGDADPGTYTVSPGGLAFSDAVVGLLSHAGGEDVGSYPITLGTVNIVNSLGASVLSNYDLTLLPASLTIDPRPITIGALPGQGKVYGNADTPLLFSVTGGFAFSDTLSSVISGSLTRAPGENVGAYLISLAGLTPINSNYLVTFDSVPRFYTITPRPITVAALPGQGKVYGEVDPQLLYQITDGSLAFADVLSGSPSRTPGENAGAYTIGQGSLTVTNIGNYAFSFTPGSFNIAPRLLTILPDADQTVETGRPIPQFRFTFTGGLAFNDTFADVFAGNLGFLTDGTGNVRFTLGDLARLSSPNYTYALSPNAPLLRVQRSLISLDAFNATRGRNNLSEDEYTTQLLFPDPNGRIFYAPPPTPAPGLVHTSSFDLFSTEVPVPQP